MAPISFSDLPQELKNEIYDSAIPMRLVPAMFRWRIFRPQSTKHRRQRYHPNPNSTKRLPAVAKAFDDAREYFLLWHQAVNTPVKTYRHVGGATLVENEWYDAPVWFSWRSDVLSLSELAECNPEEFEWVLDIENGPAKLLDDKRCAIAFNRDFVQCQGDLRRGNNFQMRTRYRIVKSLLQRVADHKEWIFIVGKVTVQLRQDQETRRRFPKDQDIFLVDVDDQETIDWLLSNSGSHEQDDAPLLNGCGTFLGSGRDLWVYSLRGQRKLWRRWGITLDAEVTKAEDGRCARQAWLEAMNAFQPLGPIEWHSVLGIPGQTEDDLFQYPVKIWDEKNPFAQKCVEQMPKVKYRIKVEVIHEDQWDLLPLKRKTDPKGTEPEDDEVEEPAAEEVQKPLFYPDSDGTPGTNLDEWGAVDPKKTAREQRQRKQKSQKREAEKRRKRGRQDPRTQHEQRPQPTAGLSEPWTGLVTSNFMLTGWYGWSDIYELRRKENFWWAE